MVVSGTTVPSAFCQVFLVPLALQINCLAVIESVAVPPAVGPQSRLGAGTPSGYSAAKVETEGTISEIINRKTTMRLLRLFTGYPPLLSFLLISRWT